MCGRYASSRRPEDLAEEFEIDRGMVSETVAEPFLVRMGFLARTPRGRVATAAAWRHLGLAPPPVPPAVPADQPLFEE